MHSYILNLRNGIPILPFMHDRSDDQLPKLGEFLMSLDPSVDVRLTISNHFRYEAFTAAEDLMSFADLLNAK